MLKGLCIILTLFIISCSNRDNKIKILLDSSQDINDFIEAVSADFEYENKEFNIEIIKFNNFKELYNYIKLPLNNADLIIANSNDLEILYEENLLKTWPNNYDDLINAKILSTVIKNDGLKAVPISIANKLIVYLNTSLIKEVDILKLEDINKLCDLYDKTCFDVYPEFKLASIIHANTDDKIATENFFNDNISKGKLTGVLNINDARNRFFDYKVPLLFDYDSKYRIYKDKLKEDLKIFKLPVAFNKVLHLNNESVAISLFKSANKEAEIINKYIELYISEKHQGFLMNNFNKLSVLNSLLKEAFINNEIKIISYRQFELSNLVEYKDNFDIYSIFTDK